MTVRTRSWNENAQHRGRFKSCMHFTFQHPHNIRHNHHHHRRRHHMGLLKYDQHDFYSKMRTKWHFFFLATHLHRPKQKNGDKRKAKKFKSDDGEKKNIE